MRENKLYIADCFDIIGSVVKRVDYVFAGPPDFAELGLDPVRDKQEWIDFIFSVLDLLTEITECITILQTDRKHGSVIIPKHKFIINFFEECGWYFKSHKIWIKSDKINLYRLNYSHIMTFSRNKSFSVKLGQMKQADFMCDCLQYAHDYKNLHMGCQSK